MYPYSPKEWNLLDDIRFQFNGTTLLIVLKICSLWSHTWSPFPPNFSFPHPQPHPRSSVKGYRDSVTRFLTFILSGPLEQDKAIFDNKVRNSCVREVNNYVVTEFYPKNPLFFFVLKLLPLGIDSELTTVFHLIVPIMSLASHKNLHGHCCARVVNHTLST